MSTNRDFISKNSADYPTLRNAYTSNNLGNGHVAPLPSGDTGTTNFIVVPSFGTGLGYNSLTGGPESNTRGDYPTMSRAFGNCDQNMVRVQTGCSPN